MDDQMKEAFCWRCIKCGRVLLTAGGATRHLEHCKMIPQVLEGQMSFEDIGSKEDGHASIDRGR